MADDVPSTPGAPLSRGAPSRPPCVDLEIDRRAASIDGLETTTCLACGQARATERVQLLVPGRFRSLPLWAAFCLPCHARMTAAWERVARVRRVSRGVYIAQMIALGVTVGLGAGHLVLTGLTALLVSTWGLDYALKRRALAEQPRLLEVKPTTVRLRAPETWARVLVDERPRALARPPAAVGRPASVSPPAPGR